MKNTNYRNEKRIILKTLFSGILILLIITTVFLLNYYNLIPKKHYSSEHFGFETVYSSFDYNNNGRDDYTDIVLGARKDAKNKPKYDGSYHEGGYPTDNIGVCTDVVWRAFREAGYNLKEMVDEDIRKNTDIYLRVEGSPDTNIDFRRVPNLKLFFERYAISLTLKPSEIEEWQPGDIVTYGTKHIAIVSDRRNKKGIPYIIHNAGQPVREEDALIRGKISGHFRFDASKLEDTDLVRFVD